VIELRETLESLAHQGVEFIIVGGVAMNLHGSAHVTFDLDICYARHSTNLTRIVAALSPYHPRPRDLPERLPFIWDEHCARAAGRTKDLLVLPELEALREVAEENE
jgi:hypothetical protein